MIHWFHRLFHPHCPECEMKPACQNCETLRSLLTTEKHEKQQLLERLIELTRPEKKEPEERKELPKVVPMPTTWRMRQQLLEQEDRAKAEAIRKRNEELEKETGVKT